MGRRLAVKYRSPTIEQVLHCLLLDLASIDFDHCCSSVPHRQYMLRRYILEILEAFFLGMEVLLRECSSIPASLSIMICRSMKLSRLRLSSGNCLNGSCFRVSPVTLALVYRGEIFKSLLHRLHIPLSFVVARILIFRTDGCSYGRSKEVVNSITIRTV